MCKIVHTLRSQRESDTSSFVKFNSKYVHLALKIKGHLKETITNTQNAPGMSSFGLRRLYQALGSAILTVLSANEILRFDWLGYAQ